MSERTTEEYRLVEAGTNRVLITYCSESAAVKAWMEYPASERGRIRVIRVRTESITTMSYLEWSKTNG